jgi:hypothetical protein
MRKLLLLLALAALSASPFAANTAQQEKMKACNAEAKAKGLKGAEYKKFRNECLKAKPEAATATAPEQKELTPQQQKMKNCNSLASSQGLTGDARKKFMSSCLKG